MYIIRIYVTNQLHEQFLSNWSPVKFTEHFDDKLTLLRVIACCPQATNNNMSQCWPRYISPYVAVPLAQPGRNDLNLHQNDGFTINPPHSANYDIIIVSPKTPHPLQLNVFILGEAGPINWLIGLHCTYNPDNTNANTALDKSCFVSPSKDHWMISLLSTKTVDPQWLTTPTCSETTWHVTHICFPVSLLLIYMQIDFSGKSTHCFNSLRPSDAWMRR